MEGQPRLERLPPEVFSMILRKLEPRQIRPVMQTSKAINAMAKPMFYRRIVFFKERHFRRFLRVAIRDPRILSMIHQLEVKNADVRIFRLLLCLDLRNIESATLSNGETMFAGVNHGLARAKDGLADLQIMAALLNTRITPKSRLKTVSYVVGGPDPPILSLDTLKLFRYSSLTSLRLQNLRLDRFADDSVEELPLENLVSLHLEVYKYSEKILEKLLRNAKSLRRFEFHHPFHETNIDTPDFTRLLRPCRETIKVIELCWDCKRPYLTGGSMKLADFTSLQYIAVPPRVLFGSYIYDGDIDWLPKLRTHLPPSLKVLFLEDIAINETRIPGENSDIPDWVLLPCDFEMIKTLIDYEELFPSLTIIAWTSAVDTPEPCQLSDPAFKLGITIECVKNRLKLEPDEEWLDELERTPSTQYSDSGSECSKIGSEESSEE